MATTNTFATTDDLNTAISVVKASIPASSQGLTKSDVIALIKANAPTSTGSSVPMSNTNTTVNGLTFKFNKIGNIVVLSGGGTATVSTLTTGFGSVVPPGFRPADKDSINVNGKSASSTISSMGISTIDTDGTFTSSTAQTKNNDMVYNISGMWVSY